MVNAATVCTHIATAKALCYFAAMVFILLLFSCLLLSSGATSSSDAVLDSDGNEVQRGELYYAESVFWGAGGGGLSLESAGDNQSCPLYVIKSHPLDAEGRPVMLFPENEKEDTVRQGNTLYVIFPEPTPCEESTVWRLSGENNVVVTGGTTSSAIGPHDSRFALNKSGLGYTIKQCPCSVGAERPSCRMGCSGDLGVVDGAKLKRALGVNTNNPHEVVFVKVKKGENGSMIRSKA